MFSMCGSERFLAGACPEEWPDVQYTARQKEKTAGESPTGEKTQYLRYYFNDAPIQYMSVWLTEWARYVCIQIHILFHAFPECCKSFHCFHLAVCILEACIISQASSCIYYICYICCIQCLYLYMFAVFGSHKTIEMTGFFEVCVNKCRFYVKKVWENQHFFAKKNHPRVKRQCH